jgi:hypothetical protein
MQTKQWYQSKTIWASTVGLVVAVLVALGQIDSATGAKLGGILLPIICMFLRISDVPIGSGTDEPKTLDLTPN